MKSKLESPKSLESDESEFESKNSDDLRNSEIESQNNKLRYSDSGSQVSKNRRNSVVESKTQTKKNNETQNKVVCDCCPQNKSHISNEIEFLYAFVTINVKDKVLPPSFAKEGKYIVLIAIINITI